MYKSKKQHEEVNQRGVCLARSFCRVFCEGMEGQFNVIQVVRCRRRTVTLLNVFLTIWNSLAFCRFLAFTSCRLLTAFWCFTSSSCAYSLQKHHWTQVKYFYYIDCKFFSKFVWGTLMFWKWFKHVMLHSAAFTLLMFLQYLWVRLCISDTSCFLCSGLEIFTSATSFCPEILITDGK